MPRSDRVILSETDHSTSRRPRKVEVRLGQFAFSLVLLAAGAGLMAKPALAQNYLTQIGRPTFTTAQPVELGYVNLSNGNLHLEIPLASPPQRGRLRYAAALDYDSRVWQVVYNGTAYVWQPTNVPNSWGGWRFVTAKEGGSATWVEADDTCGLNDYPLDTFGPFTWTEPNGTQHTFPITTILNLCHPASSVKSGNALAQDSTGYHMYVSNYTTVTVYRAEGGLVYPGLEGEDLNGNYYTQDSNGNLIDTLGRTPVTVVSNCNGNSSKTCYDIPNSQGTTSQVTVTTETINVSTNFGQAGVTEYSGTLTVVQSIALPDGTSYSFNYDSGTSSGHYGELTSLTLPTGGQITYGWTKFTDASGNANVWANTHASGGGTWTFAPQVLTTCPTGFTKCQQVTVTKPGGDNAVYTLGLNNGAWAAQAQFYTGAVSSGNLLKTVSTSWNLSNPCPTQGCTGSAYIQRMSETTTLPTTQGGSINRMVQYTYDSIYDNNVTQISEWKYYTGSLPASADRTTSIQYLTGSNYPNAISLSTNITVKDGGGNPVAQTNITYDSYGTGGLTAVTGAAHHDDTNYGTGFIYRGNPTQIQRCAAFTSGSCTSWVTTALTYDTTGQVTSTTDPAGNVTSLSYGDNFFTDNGANPPAAYTPSAPTNAYLTKVTPPLIGSATFGYYFNTGKGASSADQNGADGYAHFLDPLDRPTNTYGPLISGSRAWALASYPSETEADAYTGIGDTSPSTGCSSCRHDQVLLDGLGRAITNNLVSDPDGQTTVATTYDTTGRVYTVSNPYRSTSDATYGLNTVTSYDGLDRALTVQHPDNNTAKVYYGAAVSSNGGAASQLCATSTYGIGYPTLSVDEAGLKSQTWTDGFGRTIEVDEPDASKNLTVNTCYAYDANNNLTQVVQGTQTRSYTYDGLSRVTAATTPESGVTNFYYATSGGTLCAGDSSAVCRRTDARSITTTYTYDALNRLTGKTYTDTTPSVSYYYDQTSYNGLTITSGKGRLTGMSDTSGATAWSYDPAGRVVTEQRTISGVTKTVSYAYYGDGSLKWVTYPSGRVITYAVGNAERGTSAADSANGINYATGAKYAPQGGPSNVLHGQVTGGFGGITESYTYNNRLEWSTAQASSSAGTALNWVYNFVQAAGNNGSVASVTNSLDTGRTQSFTYDPLDRVLSAQASATSGADCWGLGFGSNGLADDALGNLLLASVTKCSAPSLSASQNGNNQLTGFSYDAAGNMTGDGTYTYTYDAEDRITTAAGVTYTYDGNGLRVKKSNGTLYWRAYWGDALAETDLSGNTTSEYVFFAGRRIARRDSSGNVYYYFADMLGSTRVITNATGATCFDADYYPYGGEMDHTNTCPQNYKFTGYERDAETGLDYAFFRYYNSRLGRFMSPDPLGGSVSNPQSLNRYAYVLNNPANAIDPVGLACKDPFDPICIPDTDFGGGGGGNPVPLICSPASSNCDPFGLLGPVSPTIGGFRAGDGGFFGGGPQCTVNGGFVACSLAYWLDRVNDDLGCQSKEGCFPPIGLPKKDPEQSLGPTWWLQTKVFLSAHLLSQSPTRTFLNCATNGNVLKAGATTGLDVFGAIPLAGNVAHGLQLAAGFVSAGLSLSGSFTNAAVSGGSLGLSIADTEKLTTNITLHGTEIVPILGNFISAGSAVKDVVGQGGVINSFKACRNGTN